MHCILSAWPVPGTADSLTPRLPRTLPARSQPPGAACILSGIGSPDLATFRRQAGKDLAAWRRAALLESVNNDTAIAWRIVGKRAARGDRFCRQLARVARPQF